MAKAVCVTGASGYVASWLVKRLLERGYCVHATVRNIDDPYKIGHLEELDGAGERLRFFEADLMEEGSFDAAVDGCEGVFHTATPVILENVSNPQEELLEPAVKGTLNVLRSCVKAPSVKRVVLTSSMASVIANRRPKSADSLIDETWFSDVDFCEEIKFWYVVCKTLQEEAARKYAEENGIDLLVINSGLVSGPPLQPILNTTSENFVDLLTRGKCTAMPGGIFYYIDVRDLAEAHILAFESPTAHGRYCAVVATMFASEVLNIARSLYPTLIISKSTEKEMELYKVSNEKLKSLGINFTPVEQSIKDTVENLIQRNLLSFST